MTEPIIDYYTSGKISSKAWYSNGKYHRIDGPAYTEYHSSHETIFCKCWYLNGLPHRENGPTYIEYTESGDIYCKQWYLHGKQHRIDGPAQIFYFVDKITFQRWYLNGEQILPEEWLEEKGYNWPLTEDQRTEFLLTFA